MRKKKVGVGVREGEVRAGWWQEVRGEWGMAGWVGGWLRWWVWLTKREWQWGVSWHHQSHFPGWYTTTRTTEIREKHTRGHSPTLGQNKAIVTTLQTNTKSVSFLQRMEAFIVYVKKINTPAPPFNLHSVYKPGNAQHDWRKKKSVPISCTKLKEQRVNIQIKSSAFMQNILFDRFKLGM